MDNKKIPTGLGICICIIIIFCLTIIIFMQNYYYIDKMPPVIKSTNITAQNPSNTKKNSGLQDILRTQQQNNLNNAATQSDNCHTFINAKRICKDGSYVDMFDSGCSPVPCKENTDGKNTSYISPFVKNYDQIYYNGPETQGMSLTVNGADASTFKPVGICGTIESKNTFYAKDKNHVYINSRRIDNINPESFEFLGLFTSGNALPYSVSISKDNNNVYFDCGKTMDSIDTKSFKILGNGYSKDKTSIYYLFQVLNIADPKTFATIPHKKTITVYGNFASDSKYVYEEGMVIAGVDPKVCKAKGLDQCLPENWHDLVDSSTYWTWPTTDSPMPN